MRIAKTVSVTVVRTVVDAFGDFVSQSTHSIGGCAVFPTRTGTEIQNPGQDTVSVDAVIVAPIGSDVLVTDQVQMNDTTYQVSNTPYELQSPFTGTDKGLAIPLRASTG